MSNWRKILSWISCSDFAAPQIGDVSVQDRDYSSFEGKLITWSGRRGEEVYFGVFRAIGSLLYGNGMPTDMWRAIADYKSLKAAWKKVPDGIRSSDPQVIDSYLREHFYDVNFTPLDANYVPGMRVYKRI